MYAVGVHVSYHESGGQRNTLSCHFSFHLYEGSSDGRQVVRLGMQEPAELSCQLQQVLSAAMQEGFYDMVLEGSV